MSPSGPRVEVVELTEAPAVCGDEMAEATAETLRTLTRPPSRVAQPARMIFLYSCGGARRKEWQISRASLGQRWRADTHLECDNTIVRHVRPADHLVHTVVDVHLYRDRLARGAEERLLQLPRIEMAVAI